MICSTTISVSTFHIVLSRAIGQYALGMLYLGFPGLWRMTVVNVFQGLKGYPKSNNTWEDANQIHAPDLIKLYHWNNPLQGIKGQLLSLQKPHLPTWLSSTSHSLHSLPILSSPLTIRI